MESSTADTQTKATTVLDEQVLYPQTLTALQALQNKEIMRDYYLAGGTALALQLGHRKSIDLDFFIDKFPTRHEQILKNFAGEPIEITQLAPGTLDLLYQSTKVSFLEFAYPLLAPLVTGENYPKLKLASVLDIACMKLNAIAGRGGRKDFYDFYFILQKYTLAEIFRAAQRKYAGAMYHDTHYLRALNYFVDADNDPEVDMITAVEWETVKTKISQEVKHYLKSELN